MERAFEQEYGEKRSARTNSASKELTRHLSIRRQKSDANLTKAKCEPETSSLQIGTKHERVIALYDFKGTKENHLR